MLLPKSFKLLPLNGFSRNRSPRVDEWVGKSFWVVRYFQDGNVWLLGKFVEMVWDFSGRVDSFVGALNFCWGRVLLFGEGGSKPRFWGGLETGLLGGSKTRVFGGRKRGSKKGVFPEFSEFRKQSGFGPPCITSSLPSKFLSANPAEMGIT